MSDQVTVNAKWLAELAKERDALLAENERFKVALERLACLGNGDKPGNSEGNLIAQQALALEGKSGE